MAFDHIQTRRNVDVDPGVHGGRRCDLLGQPGPFSWRLTIALFLALALIFSHAEISPH